MRLIDNTHDTFPVVHILDVELCQQFMLRCRPQTAECHGVWEIMHTITEAPALHKTNEQCVTANDIFLITASSNMIRADNLLPQSHNEEMRKLMQLQQD